MGDPLLHGENVGGDGATAVLPGSLIEGLDASVLRPGDSGVVRIDEQGKGTRPTRTSGSLGRHCVTALLREVLAGGRGAICHTIAKGDGHVDWVGRVYADLGVDLDVHHIVGPDDLYDGIDGDVKVLDDHGIHRGAIGAGRGRR